MLNPFLIWLKYKKALESGGGGSSDCIHSKCYDVYVQTQEDAEMPKASFEGITFQKVREAFEREQDAVLELSALVVQNGDNVKIELPYYKCEARADSGTRIGSLLLFSDIYQGDNMVCGINVPEEYLGIMVESFGIEFPESGFYVLAEYAGLVDLRWTLKFDIW